MSITCVQKREYLKRMPATNPNGLGWRGGRLPRERAVSSPRCTQGKLPIPKAGGVPRSIHSAHPNKLPRRQICVLEDQPQKVLIVEHHRPLISRPENLMLSVVILHFHKRVIIFTEAAPNTPARMTDGGARTGRVRQAARDHPSPANRDFVAVPMRVESRLSAARSGCLPYC